MDDILCAVTECPAHPFLEHPIALCRRHALMVSLNVTDVLHATALTGHTTPGLGIEAATVAPETVWAQSSHQSVVYFLANGDRVKIGVSTNVAARVSALSFRKGNVLLLLQGGYDLEADLHDHFQADRVGRTEWFVLSSRIRDYVGHRLKADAAMRQPSRLVDEVTDTNDETPAKPLTADERILDVLEEAATPPHPGGIYVHKDRIAVLASVPGTTLANRLSQLVKADLIHRKTASSPYDPYSRGRDVRGYYGLGPAPAASESPAA